MFKVGDVVVLKSGGRKMTIEHILEDGAFCVWLDDTGHEHGRIFKFTSLERA